MVGSTLIGRVAHKVWNFPILLCLVVVMLVALLFCLLNGLLVGKLNLLPFIATLGMQFISFGSNEDAGELSGIQTSYWKTIVYIENGFFVGLAGIIYAATYTTITTQTGNGQEMYAIAACVMEACHWLEE